MEKQKFNIAIIDSDKIQNDSLSNELKTIGYSVNSIYELASTDLLEATKCSCELLIINIDNDINFQEHIDFIIKNLDIKLMLLSKDDDKDSQRDNYFKQGVLDYHNISKGLKHIAYDIDETISMLNTNKKETVLIIDDSKVICYVLKHLLETKNYNIFMAHNATDGLDIISTQKVSLLILDMELPDMHGLELMTKIREMNLLINFEVLTISGSSNPSIVRQALKGGASDFLKKPFLYEEFLLKCDSRIKSAIAQRTIREQKKQFEALVDATIDAMFIFEDTICKDTNKEGINLLGYTDKSDIVGKELNDIFKGISQEHREFLLDDKKDYEFEDTLEDINGKTYNVQIKEKNLSIVNKPMKIVAVMDITVIKQNEKMMSHQTKMASMGEMIGNIAHQWRQPLTAISVAAGGIKLNYEFDMADKEETIKELDNIVENTQFLSSTIESFQNFLKDERKTEEFDIEATVKKTLTIISANLVSNNIHIIENYKTKVRIYGIQNELVQVFLNIINNASDVLKTIKKDDFEKYIIISVDLVDDNAVITIQDNAGGIPDNIIGKIFEPYFTTKHQSQGTGLGLYMTHQIVTKMKGSIKVENSRFRYKSKEYLGAKFTISLPK